MIKKTSFRLPLPATAFLMSALLILSPLNVSASENSPGLQGPGPDEPFPADLSMNEPPGGIDVPPGKITEEPEWDAIEEITEDTNEEEIDVQSNGDDEIAVLVHDGAEVKILYLDLERNSADSTGGDMASFYGVGSAFLNADGTAYLASGDILTNAAGGAGIFSYDKGVTYIEDFNINTLQNTSGGLHVAGGGELYAWDTFVSTEGESSAAIRSDRGGGKMVIDGGEYVSLGSGSPAIYSTADISVHNAILRAEGSEGICLEGKNSVRLFDAALSSSMKEDERNDCTWSVIVYQSMSGDSEPGEGTFEMVGGSLSSNNGGLFYTTNTKSRFLLSGVDISTASKPDFFLRATGNANKRGWGKSGENGADCVFTLKNQKAEGDVIYDSISNLRLFLTDGSTLTGAVREDESASTEGGNGTSALIIDKNSKWIVTGNSVLAHLSNEGTIEDADGKKVSVLDDRGNVLEKGNSDFTVTVADYGKNADVSEASKEVKWESLAEKKPAYLVENEYDTEDEALFTEEADESQIEEYEIDPEETAEEEIDTPEEEKKSSPVKAVMVIAVGAIAVLIVLFRKKLVKSEKS